MQLNPLKIVLYPCKGLPGIEFAETQWRAGRGIWGDRHFALQFLDESAPQKETEKNLVAWMSKKYLLNQHDFPELAKVKWEHLQFSKELHNFEEFLAQFSPQMRENMEHYFNSHLQHWTPLSAARHPQKTPLRLVGNSSTHELQNSSYFRDSQAHEISFINLASVRHFEEKFGAKIEVERFRGNVLVELAEPWAEMNFDTNSKFSLQHASVNNGQMLQLKFGKQIARCLNINVCPISGTANKELLQFMNSYYKHPFLGFSLQVV
jgi:uncharacterized protein